jgi:3-dehydroquinate dehydratase
MKVEDIQRLLTAVSECLRHMNDFPVFEEVIENNGYYTMSDLSLGDAIQTLNEIEQGLENVNDRDQFPDLCLTPDLQTAIASLVELGAEIIRVDAASSSCEDKMAVK